MSGTSFTSAVRRSLVIAAWALSALTVVSPAVAEDTFAIGFVPGDVTSLALRFAEVAGTYAKYQIKPELNIIEVGSRGVQVLLAGKLQAMHAGFSIVVNANREGADLRLVRSSSNVMPMEIYVVPTVRSAADLKGQKIAVSAPTSETNMAMSMALRHWSMTRQDVVLTSMGAASQRLAAQLSGQALASVYVSPATIIAKEKGLVRLLDLSEEGSPWLFNGLAVNREFAKSNPDLLKRFLKANIEGLYKASSDEKWAKEVIAK